MLALTVKNKSLDLSPETEISLVHSCPLFDRVRVSRVFSFPFKLPLSPKNLNALKYASRFDAKNAWRENSAQIRGAGEIENGELVVTSSRPDYMEVAFRNTPVDISERLKEIRINTILEEVPVPVTSPPAAVCLSLDPIPFEKVIEIGGTLFFLSQAEWEAMTDLEILQHFENAINAVFPGMAFISGLLLCLNSDQVDATVPEWHVMIGFVFDAYITVGEYHQTNLVNYVETLFGTPDERFFFPTIRWRNFYSDNLLAQEFINPVFNGQGAENTASSEKEWVNTYLPFVRVKYVIERIAETIGVALAPGVWDQPDWTDLYIPNNYSLDFLYRSWDENETWKYLNGFQSTINLNRHVPDITASEFLQRLCEGLNLTVDFRNGGMYFRRGLSYIASPPNSVEVDLQEYDFKVNKPKGLYLYFDLSRELYSMPAQLQPYVIAPEERRRQMSYNIMFMDTSFVYLHGAIRCPHTDQKGVSSATGGNKSELPLYLVFNRGQANSNSGETYLYATSDNKNASGTVVYNWSLDLNGSAGVVATQFGPLISAEDRPTLEIPAVMPIERFSILKKFTNARIRFFSPNGEVTAIITSMKTAVGITDTEVRVDLSLLIL